MRGLRAVLLTVLFVVGTFAVSATASLIDGGEVHQGPDPVEMWFSTGGDEVLTLDGEGVFMALRWNGGAYQVTRAVDLNVTVNAVRLDLAGSLLAVGHSSGALVLDLDTDAVTREISLPDPVDHLDWDDDGDLWVVHNGGLRQAGPAASQGRAVPPDRPCRPASDRNRARARRTRGGRSSPEQKAVYMPRRSL